MEEELKTLKVFLELDQELKERLKYNFNGTGMVIMTECLEDILSNIINRLGLTEDKREEFMRCRGGLTDKLLEKFSECADTYCSEVNKITTSPEELTNGTYAVDEDTYGRAVMHCKRVGSLLERLDDRSIGTKSAESEFSSFAIDGANYIGMFIENKIGTDAARKYEYYLESETYSDLVQAVGSATGGVYRRSMDDFTSLQMSAKGMNIEISNNIRASLESTLK